MSPSDLNLVMEADKAARKIAVDRKNLLEGN
jgi:hypothetical protein